MKHVLKRAGLKQTPSRVAIMNAMEDRHCPLSADEIHERCKTKKIDLVTVYRNLKNFEEKGIVRKSIFGDGTDRFELSLHAEHHHHLVCRQCHTIQKLPDCNFKALEQFAKTKGFSQLTHQLEIFGLCRSCA